MTSKIEIMIDTNDIGKLIKLKESDLELIKNSPNRHKVANALFRLCMDLGIEIE